MEPEGVRDRVNFYPGHLEVIKVEGVLHRAVFVSRESQVNLNGSIELHRNLNRLSRSWFFSDLKATRPVSSPPRSPASVSGIWVGEMTHLHTC